MPEWLKALVVIFVVGFLFVMSRMESLNPPSPVDDGVTDAGVVISCSYHPKDTGTSGWSEITTDKGTYNVPGKFRTTKGHRLVIMQKPTTGKWLEDETEHFAAPLLIK
jgi:hypothetical protein